ncbi:NAD(P)/FAD-dependent oxidoreductase [Dongia soli]|uniref:FAD-binding oxidoreductase n=1 Tax=Dongia soli TaxID=600628 RepID=A0ABU5EBU1_9PROT|nr:FAD-binding oxidoreductase [Dongia soli]MDY0883658.1 FAD-binding oxidoreductase [Dongia soli]
MRSIRRLPADDQTNGWLKHLPPRQPRPSLEGAVTADWLVVGAGYAGLAAARRLAENRPTDHIILVDARAVGDGASGRNSGFAIDLPHHTSGDLQHLDTARRAIRLNRLSIAYLEDIVKTYGIDCQWSRRGQIMAASAPLGARHLTHFKSMLEALEEPYDYLNQDKLAATLGTRFYSSAIRTPHTVLMQPAALVRGLADTLPPNVTLYENSPVTKIGYGDRITAATPNGAIQARKVVLCVDGFAPQFGLYRGRLFGLRIFASITRPLSADERRALGGEEDWGVLPAARFGGGTLRYTQDHRLLLRSSYAYRPSMVADAATNSKVALIHRRKFDERFPMLGDVPFEATWSGFLCMSKNAAPGFGRHAPNVFSAICQNGVGVTKGTQSGILIADMACGIDNPLIADMEALGQPNRVPPEPFLGLGIKANLLWQGWRSRSER